MRRMKLVLAGLAVMVATFIAASGPAMAQDNYNYSPYNYNYYSPYNYNYYNPYNYNYYNPYNYDYGHYNYNYDYNNHRG